MPQPTLGRIVHYTLADHDVAAINDQHPDSRTRNPVNAGDTFPAMVVRDWGGSVNLQVFLDGSASYWATSRKEGDGPGTWAWPTRKDG